MTVYRGVVWSIAGSVTLVGCVSTSGDLQPAVWEAAFRKLPPVPADYERVPAQPGPDRFKLEQSRWGDAKIVEFERWTENRLVAQAQVALFTWAKIDLNERRLAVACHRRMYGEYDWESSIDGVYPEAWPQGLAITVCFVDDALLVLVGRAPWGGRVGYWLDPTGTREVVTHLGLSANVLAFNPERAVVYTPGESEPWAYLDAQQMGFRSKLALSHRRTLMVLAAVMQVASPYYNPEYPPGMGQPPVHRRMLDDIPPLLEQAKFPLPPSNSPQFVSSEHVTGLNARGWAPLARHLLEVRRELAMQHASFEEAADQDRVIRLSMGLRGFIGTAGWDIFAPAGNDAPAVLGGFDIRMGLTLWDRLRFEVGPMIKTPAADGGAVDAFEGRDSSSSWFGINADLHVRLGPWDQLDALYAGVSGRWGGLGSVDVDEIVQRDVRLFALGPTLGYEGCVGSEWGLHACWLAELSVMASWISGTRTIARVDSEEANFLAERVAEVAQADRGWLAELRFGIRMGY